MNASISSRIRMLLTAAVFLLAAMTGRMTAQNQPSPVVPSANAAFWVQLRARPQLEPAQAIRDRAAQGRFVYEELHRNAAASQARVISLLQARKAKFKSFWIANAVLVNADPETEKMLAALPEVESVYAEKTAILKDPKPQPAAPRAQAAASSTAAPTVEWNLTASHIPEVWAKFGTRGQGVTIGILDGGFVPHPAINGAYRGNLGNGNFDNNYNWMDFADTPASLVPVDEYGHGSFATGIAVGLNGTDNFGVAPEAKFIACKAFLYENATEASLLGCMQWLLAPTDLNGNNPRPELRPQIVNNSWGFTTDDPALEQAVDGWRAAGMLPVFAFGNLGPMCSSFYWPGANAGVLGVGCTIQFNGMLALYSSRGPVPGSPGLMKPDLVAGGDGVLSICNDGVSYCHDSGTSFSTPAVSGIAALVYSAAPQWSGHPDATTFLLRGTTDKVLKEGCTPSAGPVSPNNEFGYGVVDALTAVQQALKSSPRQ